MAKSEASLRSVLDLSHAAMTHQEIAEIMGITRGGVYELEKRALIKCRKICRRRGIQFSDFLSSLVADKPRCAVE